MHGVNKVAEFAVMIQKQKTHTETQRWDVDKTLRALQEAVTCRVRPGHHRLESPPNYTIRDTD